MSPAAPVDDETLVRRARQGDADAFGGLVDRHQRRLYNLCLRITGDPEDAADACQDAFVHAFRRLETFKGSAAFTTWMHRIAVNACYDHLRRRSREPVLHVVREPADEPRRELGPPVPDHADEVAGGQDAAAALARVPEEFRAALVLADVQDLPYEEIGRILEVPVGTVKSRVFRGRLALARELGLRGREPGEASPASEDG